MLFILVFLYLGQCALSDVRTGKIPNRRLLFWLVVFGIWSAVSGMWSAVPGSWETAAAGEVPESWDAAAAGEVLESWETAVVSCVRELVGYLGGAVGVAAFFFPLFFFRMMGAGDVKMMALLGGVFGLRRGFEIIFYGLAAAAAWSLFYMARNRMFLKRIGYFLNYMMRLFYCGEVTPYYDPSRDGREAGFCLAPFVWGGYCLWLLVRWYAER